MAVELSKMAHSWHSSAAASDPWDTSGKTFEHHRKKADGAYRMVGKTLLPWYKKWELFDADKLKDMVAAFYAQERDPEFVRQRDNLKRAMLADIAQAVGEVEAIREGRKANKKYLDDLRKKGLKRGKRRT